MTADLPDRAAGRDALRAALAEALAEKRRSWNVDEPREIVADLLPVIERFAAEQVAAALNSAADVPLKACCPEHASKRIRARARAAAVPAAPHNDRRQG